MKLRNLIAAPLLATLILSPALLARADQRGPGPAADRPGGGPGDNRDGRGGFGPGDNRDGRGGFGPGDNRDGRGGFGPGDNRGWGNRGGGWGPRGPGFPPAPPGNLPPPPSFGGLCQGNFSGNFQDGRQIMVSVNGTGPFVTASFLQADPQVSLVGQGTCTSVNNVSQLTLTLTNGAVESGQIYQASDGKVYFDGTESGSNLRFILQRQ